MKIGNCLTELARKRHVIPTQQTPCWPSGCEFLAHTISIGDRKDEPAKAKVATVLETVHLFMGRREIAVLNGLEPASNSLCPILGMLPPSAFVQRITSSTGQPP